MRWGLIPTCLCCLLVAPGARCADAEAASALVTVVDTLVVAAAPVHGLSTPSVAGVVTRLDLADEVGYRDLGDLLGRVAGLQVARLGGWGATAVPSLRGSAPAQIRFFLDGMPLPDAQTGRAGFGRLPVDRLTAIEIHRGAVPVGLGGVGGAGAVNFVTRERDAGWHATVLGGSFGEIGGRLGWGGTSTDEDLAGVIVVHGRRADNDFSYLDHNQTFHRTDDDTVRIRENAWLEEWGGWGSGRWGMDGLTVRAAAGFSRRDGGRPGPIGLPSPDASVRYDRLDGQLHLDWRDGLVRLDGAAGRGNEFLYDPERQVGLTPAGVSHAFDEDLTGRATWAPAFVGDAVGLTAGADWRGQWRTETIGGRSEPERTRRAVGAFAALNAALADGRVTVAPAWRWQHTHDAFPAGPPPFGPPAVDNTRDDVSPSLGVVWEARPGALFIEAHAARAVRLPTWVELFGHRGGVDGNPKLQAEELHSADLGLSVRRGDSFSGRISAFFAETDDKIVFVQNGPRSTKALNLDRTVARGLECELGAALPLAVRFEANATIQRVTEEGDAPTYAGHEVPFLPGFEAHGRLAGRYGPWEPWVAVAHLGANYRDRANTELGRAPARTLLNLGLGRAWRPSPLGATGTVDLRAEVINLTDNAVYDVEGYPLPRRTWRLAASLRY